MIINNIMNKILNCDDIWKYIIIPYVNPRLFRCSELRSVCSRFCHLFPSCPNKSKYIKVPSTKFLTLKDAYLCLLNISYNYCNKNNVNPPEIWLNVGLFDNTIDSIRIPIVIRGMGMDRTIVKNGFKFKINVKWYKLYPNLNIILDNISIINTNPYSYYTGSGISGITQYNLYIKSCKIENCNGTGIKGDNININIDNSIICNNKKDGIHLWHDSIINVNNLEIYNCDSGIILGALTTQKKTILNNIKGNLL